MPRYLLDYDLDSTTVHETAVYGWAEEALENALDENDGWSRTSTHSGRRLPNTTWEISLKEGPLVTAQSVLNWVRETLFDTPEGTVPVTRMTVVEIYDEANWP